MEDTASVAADAAPRTAITVKDAIITASKSPANAVELAATMAASLWDAMTEEQKALALDGIAQRRSETGRVLLGRVNALLATPEDRAKVAAAKLAVLDPKVDLAKLGAMVAKARSAFETAETAFAAACAREDVADILAQWLVVPVPTLNGVDWKDAPMKTASARKTSAGGQTGTRKSPVHIDWSVTGIGESKMVFPHNPKASSGVAFVTALAGANVAADYAKGTCGVRAAIKFWSDKRGDYPAAHVTMIVRSGELSVAAAKMADELAKTAGARFTIAHE